MRKCTLISAEYRPDPFECKDLACTSSAISMSSMEVSGRSFERRGRGLEASTMHHFLLIKACPLPGTIRHSLAPVSMMAIPIGLPAGPRRTSRHRPSHAPGPSDAEDESRRKIIITPPPPRLQQLLTRPILIPPIRQIPPHRQRNLLLIQLLYRNLQRVRLPLQIHQHRCIHTDLQRPRAQHPCSLVLGHVRRSGALVAGYFF